jgi:selenocysteine lyase/cysteine desulfurase
VTGVYLNQAGTSWPKPAPVRAAAAEALGSDPESWAERLEAQHREVCDAFGVGDPSRLLLTPGATSALSVAVSDHEWEPGDRMIVSGLEHHALQRPALQLAGRGVELVVTPRAQGEPVALEALEAELRRGRVRLVAMTAASNVTGELLPIEDIVALARSHGALCLIDAAQIAGWIPIDVVRLGADLLAFAGHKGPQAPWGIGGLYVAPHVAMRSPRARCEGAGREEAARGRPMAGYCDVGSVDRVALAGLVAGLRWLGEPERSDRLSRARKQVATLADGVARLPGVTLHGAGTPEQRMPTLALTVEARSPGDLARSLAARGVLVSGGLQCAALAHETLGTAPEGVLRLSLGPSNDDDDVATAIGALRELLT